jgi:hypothetical protein
MHGRKGGLSPYLRHRVITFGMARGDNFRLQQDLALMKLIFKYMQMKTRNVFFTGL